MKKKNQTTVIVIVVILVLAVAGVLIWGFTSNWGQGKSSSQKAADKKKAEDDKLIATYTKSTNDKSCNKVIQANDSNLSDKELSMNSKNNLVLTSGTLADAIKKCNGMEECVGVDDWKADGLPNFKFCSSTETGDAYQGRGLVYIKPKP